MPINHEVKDGDCIFSIAFKYGFFADTIWNHPSNAELKKKRKDPHVLMPGDIVFVPDLRIKELSEPTDQVYKYRCKNTPKSLRIQLMGFDTPIKNMDYKLKIDGLEEKASKTDGEGWLTQMISPNAKTAKLTLADGSKYELLLGYLDPVDEVKGLQERLYSLGFYEGRIDGQINDETKGALGNFQHSHDLEITGEADAQTKDLLVQLIGE